MWILYLWFLQVVSASSNSTSLKFFLLGDWGKGGNSGSFWNKGIDDEEHSSHIGILAKSKTLYQAAVAKAMGDYGSQSNPAPSFLVALGDNFYTNGVSSTTDQSWQYLWEEVYLPYPSLNIPWYPVFGNHDYGGTPQAQLDRYAADPTGLWQFPAQYYTKKFDIPGGGTVQIIFIDTTTLAPNVCKYTSEKGGISTDVQAQRISEQLSFLKATAEAATLDPPTWLLVAGHYPIYSVGGHSDTSELIYYVADLFPKYNITAYLSGHDHISEHLEFRGTHYFVSGAGSMTDTLGSISSAAKVHWTGTEYSAFSVMTATLSSLSIDYIDYAGTLKYSYTINTPYSSYRNSPVDVIDKSEPHRDDIIKKHNRGAYNTIFNDGSVAYAGGLLFAFALVVGLVVVARTRATNPIVYTTPKITYKPSDPRRIYSVRDLYDDNYDNTDESEIELAPRKRTIRFPTIYQPIGQVRASLKASTSAYDEEAQAIPTVVELTNGGLVKSSGISFGAASTARVSGRLPSLGPKIEGHRRTKTVPF